MLKSGILLIILQTVVFGHFGPMVVANFLDFSLRLSLDCTEIISLPAFGIFLSQDLQV